MSRTRPRPFVAAVLPSEAAVLELLGTPSTPAPSARTSALVAAALSELARVAAPRAVVEELDPVAALLLLADGGGDSVVARRFDLSPAVAAFVATLGPGPEQRVAELFAAGDAAAAVALDAAASAAADLLAGHLATEWWATHGGAEPGRRAMPYSPGYCGWSLDGQRALFARLEPVDIGVKLTPSCLMVPLKSVSGLLLASDVGTIGPVPGLACCAACGDHACEGGRR